MKIVCQIAVVLCLIAMAYTYADDQLKPMKRGLRLQPKELMLLREQPVPEPIEIKVPEIEFEVPDVRPFVSYGYFFHGVVQLVNCPIDQIERKEKQRFELEIERGIATIDRICQLTESQKKKLTLSGRADFRNRLNALNRLCKEVPVNTRITASDEGEMEILLKQLSRELLDVDSFLAKSLPAILSQEQLTKLERTRQSLSRQSVLLALDDLEKRGNLGDSRRQALIDLMFEFLPTAGLVADTDVLGPHSRRMVLLYKLNENAESRVKPLLEPEQWRVLRPELEKHRDLQGVLRRRAVGNASVQFVVGNEQPVDVLLLRRAVLIEANK